MGTRFRLRNLKPGGWPLAIKVRKSACWYARRRPGGTDALFYSAAVIPFSPACLTLSALLHGLICHLRDTSDMPQAFESGSASPDYNTRPI